MLQRKTIRISKFNQQGEFIDLFDIYGKDNREFLHLHGIEIDSKGNLYVTDEDTADIQKLTKDGKIYQKMGKIW